MTADSHLPLLRLNSLPCVVDATIDLINIVGLVFRGASLRESVCVVVSCSFVDEVCIQDDPAT